MDGCRAKPKTLPNVSSKTLRFKGLMASEEPKVQNCKTLKGPIKVREEIGSSSMSLNELAQKNEHL